MLEKIEIVHVAPTKVLTLPQKYTYDTLKTNKSVLHKLSSKESDGTLICLGETFDYCDESSFEVSYPVSKLDLEKYDLQQFKSLPRIQAVLGHFSGTREDLKESLATLCDFAKKQGRQPILPYRLVYVRGKNLLFTKIPAFYVMDIYVPLEPETT